MGKGGGGRGELEVSRADPPRVVFVVPVRDRDCGVAGDLEMRDVEVPGAAADVEGLLYGVLDRVLDAVDVGRLAWDGERGGGLISTPAESSRATGKGTSDLHFVLCVERDDGCNRVGRDGGEAPVSCRVVSSQSAGGLLGIVSAGWT